MKKRGGWSVIVLISFSILFSVLCVLVMYALDRHSFLLQKVPHSISGNIWFPLISDFMLAVPANAICAFALWQTWYYHKLDEESLYPEIRMESAVLKMRLVDWDGFANWAERRENFTQEWLDEMQDYRQKHKMESDRATYSNLGFLCLQAELLLKGGESICRMKIEEIAIQAGDQEYKLKFRQNSRKFLTEYENGQEKYQIDWVLDFDDIYAIPKKKVSSQKTFWNDMYEILFDDNCNVTKRSMTWTISMKIYYGVNVTKRKRTPISAEWKIWWDWGTRKKFDNHAKECYSKNAWFKVT